MLRVKGKEPKVNNQRFRINSYESKVNPSRAIGKGKQSMVKHGRLRSKVQESKAVGFKSLEAIVHNKEVRIES